MTAGPRDRHRLTGRDEWTSAVVRETFQPVDLADVLAVAFTSACLDAIGQPEMLALKAGEVSGGHTREAYVRLARALGMGRERFRLTLQGARWVALPEVATALADPVVGPHLSRHLDRLLDGGRVLRRDRDSGGTSPPARGGARVGSAEGDRTRRGEDRPMHDTVETREARVRADVTALDRERHAAALRGSPLSGPDWGAVRLLLGERRLERPAVNPASTAARVRAAGVDSLAGLVRDVLRDADGPMPSYRVKREVRRRVEALGRGGGGPVTSAQVDTALARLAARGEVSRTGHGVYQATDQMRGRSPER